MELLKMMGLSVLVSGSFSYFVKACAPELTKDAQFNTFYASLVILWVILGIAAMFGWWRM